MFVIVFILWFSATYFLLRIFRCIDILQVVILPAVPITTSTASTQRSRPPAAPLSHRRASSRFRRLRVQSASRLPPHQVVPGLSPRQHSRPPGPTDTGQATRTPLYTGSGYIRYNNHIAFRSRNKVSWRRRLSRDRLRFRSHSSWATGDVAQTVISELTCESLDQEAGRCTQGSLDMLPCRVCEYGVFGLRPQFVDLSSWSKGCDLGMFVVYIECNLQGSGKHCPRRAIESLLLERTGLDEFMTIASAHRWRGLVYWVEILKTVSV